MNCCSNADGADALIVPYREPPFCRMIMTLFKLIWDETYVTMSGSAPLAQYLDIGGYNNDVDLSVPLYPSAMKRFYQDGTRTRPDPAVRPIEEFQHKVLDGVLRSLYRDYGYAVSVLYVHFIPGFETTSEYTFNLRSLCGIAQIWNLKLKDIRVGRVSKPIQLICFESFPNRMDVSWGDHVTDLYDADIVKCRIEPLVVLPMYMHLELDERRWINPVSWPVTVTSAIKSNLEQGKFHFTVRPGQTFEQVWKRMLKYRSRGFKLHELSFDDRMIHENRRYMISAFEHRLCRTFMRNDIDKCGILPEDILSSIASFLDPFPPGREQNRTTMLAHAVHAFVSMYRSHPNTFSRICHRLYRHESESESDDDGPYEQLFAPRRRLE